MQVIYLPDNLSIGELAEILNEFPEKGYKFVIYGFDEDEDFEG